MEVYYLEGNRKRSYTTVLCLSEMAYSLSWNIYSLRDYILSSIDTHTHMHKGKKGVKGEDLIHLSGFN